MVFWFGGGRWIRTTEAISSRFTVCPLWPLGNSPRCSVLTELIYYSTDGENVKPFLKKFTLLFSAGVDEFLLEFLGML